MTLVRMAAAVCLFVGPWATLAIAQDTNVEEPADPPRSKWEGPLPDLETLEDCMRKDLGWWWGKTLRFHRRDCWANVTFDDRGKVTAFEPDDADACRRVLPDCL